MKITTEKLVDAFLAWPLPESVNSDGCATIAGYPNRSGTNLLTAIEAQQMFEHVLAKCGVNLELDRACVGALALEATIKTILATQDAKLAGALERVDAVEKMMLEGTARPVSLG